MLEALQSPVARTLLESTIPARLSFLDGSGNPRVTPIWFTWRNDCLVMCAGWTSFKVRCIRRHPEVEVLIDREAAPYATLRVRGRADLEEVPGIPQEYADCAYRYYGADAGERWLTAMRGFTSSMARITLTPAWAEAFDFNERFPGIFDA